MVAWENRKPNSKIFTWVYHPSPIAWDLSIVCRYVVGVGVGN